MTRWFLKVLSKPNHPVVLQSLPGGGMGSCKLDFSELWFWKRLYLELAGVDLGEESGSDCRLMVVHLRLELFGKGEKNSPRKGGISTCISMRCGHGEKG